MADENPVSRDPEDSRAKCDGCREGGGRKKAIQEWVGEAIQGFQTKK